jgi:hypothetical protein
LTKEDKNISWTNVILTYIKNVQEEHVAWSLIVHYYDEGADDFRRVEISLDGLGSPAFLAAAVEAYKIS